MANSNFHDKIFEYFVFESAARNSMNVNAVLCLYKLEI